MPLPPHAAGWKNRSEMDYIGPFVKAWAAFNAWYRHTSGASRERDMLDYVKNQPNSARRNILPLFDIANVTAEALRLRQAIYDLHRSLDGVELEVTKNQRTERISLRSVCIAPRALQNAQRTRHIHEYKVSRVQGGEIEISVTSLNSGRVKFLFRQQIYNPDEVYGFEGFVHDLSAAQKTTLQSFYDGCNPRPMRDLLHGDGPGLVIVGTRFQCSRDELFFGLIETIYAMRNALLHGEVDPDAQVLSCYEPAYRIVVFFLDAIT